MLDLAPITIVLVPLLCAALLAWPRLGPAASKLALAPPIAVAAMGIHLWEHLSPGEVMIVRYPWLPSLGIDLSLRVDRLGLFFVCLIGLIGLGIFQYAGRYLGERATRGFWALMLVFTSGMLTIVLSESLVLLYIGWELTTVTSALLIARASPDEPARTGAVQAFIVTALGGLSMLAGIVLLGTRHGAFTLTALVERSPAIVADPGHILPLLLLLVGAFTKSAQFPFHVWLPGAMAAPAPVSAYLHSATMVKAGIILIARLFPAFSTSPIWFPVLTVVGLSSFVIAGWSALRSDDVKKLLAYSTVAYLGLLVAHYGYSGRVGLRGELLNIANHALYKSALFLLVGWVEKATGTRDLRTLARERWPPHEPVGTVLFGLGALAMAGSPLLLGFLSKELFLEAVIGKDHSFTPQMLVVVLASGLSFAYGLKIFTAMLFGAETPPPERRAQRGSLSRWLLAIPALLLVPQVLGGVAPRLTLAPFVAPDTHLPSGPAIWQHADAVLWMSLASFAVGGLLYVSWQRLAHAPRLPWTSADIARLLAKAVLSSASWSSRRFLAGGLPRYNALVLVATATAVAAGLFWPGATPLRWPGWGPDVGLGWVPAFATAAAAVLVLWMRRRLTQVVMLGIVGYGVAFFYVLFRAPDLVLTQILVESVALVLLLLVLRQLPPIGNDGRSWWTRVGHFSAAGLVGLMAAALAWLGADEIPKLAAGREHLLLSLAEGHGRNAVNVILVDFRGADTFAENIVLAIATLGVISLGLGRPLGSAPDDDMRSYILSRSARLLFPITVIFSLYLLLRGHNHPGGGFSAGLVTVLALVIEAYAFGRDQTRARLEPLMRPALWLGLFILSIAALMPVAFGEPFLTHHHLTVPVPGLGEVPLSTTLLFDAGVYATVVGTTALTLTSLAEGT